MSLHTYLHNSYGEEVYKATTNLKQLKKRSAAAKTQWIFLERCFYNKILPKSFRTKPPINTSKAWNATFLHNLNMVRTARDDAKYRYHQLRKSVTTVERFLSNRLSEKDYQLIDRITEKSREHFFLKNRDRLKDKFESLSRKKQSHIQNKHLKPSVLNLVKKQLPESHQALLNLGPKFVPVVRTVPHFDIITNVEIAVQQLSRNENKPGYDGEQIRDRVANILSKNINFKPKKQPNP